MININSCDKTQRLRHSLDFGSCWRQTREVRQPCRAAVLFAAGDEFSPTNHGDVSDPGSIMLLSATALSDLSQANGKTNPSSQIPSMKPDFYHNNVCDFSFLANLTPLFFDSSTTHTLSFRQLADSFLFSEPNYIFPYPHPLNILKMKTTLAFAVLATLAISHAAPFIEHQDGGRNTKSLRARSVGTKVGPMVEIRAPEPADAEEPDDGELSEREILDFVDREVEDALSERELLDFEEREDDDALKEREVLDFEE
jgi:hypothetical protein